MSALKIVFIAGDKQIVLYGTGMKQMWQVESHVLERLGKEERLKLDTASFRKYWIDEEGDRVEIMNDFDFEFFLKRGGHKTPKIYFEAIYSSNVSEQPQPSTGSAQFQRANLTVHDKVSCDCCNAEPIVGFRYKCLQCHNFDICGKCEANMKHPEHTMLRIPNSELGLWKASLFSPAFSGNRRHKKYAAAAAAAAAAASSAGVCGEAQQAEGKSRHHRHHRRHCAGATGATGIFSNLYEMMQDLAEGGVAAPDSPAAETAEKQQQQQQQSATAPPQEQATTSDSVAGNTTQSKETNTSPDRSAKSAEAAAGTKVPTSPSLENIQNFIDPHFMKAGIQILNNFSEMFGKILDPAVVGKENKTGNTSSSGNENVSHAGSATPSVVNIDLTGPSTSATPPPTAAGTPKETPGTKEASAAGSGTVTPMETMETEVTQLRSSQTSAPHSRNSQSEENDWTMIDNTVATSTTAEDTDVTARAYAASNAALAAAAAANNTARAAAASVAAATPQFDFAQLSQQLQSHIENEMKQFSQTTNVPTSENSIPTSTVSSRFTSVPAAVPVIAPPSNPAPIPTPVLAPNPVVASNAATATAPAPTANTETRAVAVFHTDPHINSAVHAMMAMGFSNEGAMLTQLLESVNGSIPLALDLMSAAQRN